MRLAAIATVPMYHAMRSAAALGIVGCILAIAVGPVRAQQARTVHGVITDMDSAVPIPFVEVVLVHDGHLLTDRATTSDVAGHFSIQVDGGDDEALYSRRIGYAPMLTELGDAAESGTGTVTIRLRVAATTLTGTTVIADHAQRNLLLSGFDRRRELGLGAFFTYAEIQKRGTPELADLLRDVPGVRIHRSGGRVAVELGRTPASDRCGPVVYMDGQRVTRSTDPPHMAGDLIASTMGTSLEAVEVYRGRGELPPEFADPDTRCGAIVIWTLRPNLHLPAPKKPSSQY